MNAVRETLLDKGLNRKLNESYGEIKHKIINFMGQHGLDTSVIDGEFIMDFVREFNILKI